MCLQKGVGGRFSLLFISTHEFSGGVGVKVLGKGVVGVVKVVKPCFYQFDSSYDIELTWK